MKHTKIINGESIVNVTPSAVELAGDNVLKLASVGVDPTGSAGSIAYRSDTNQLRWHNGTVWANVASAGGTTLKHYYESVDAGVAPTVETANTASSFVANQSLTVSAVNKSLIAASSSLIVRNALTSTISGMDSTVQRDTTTFSPTYSVANASMILVESNIKMGTWDPDESPTQWLFNNSTITDVSAAGPPRAGYYALSYATSDMSNRGWQTIYGCTVYQKVAIYDGTGPGGGMPTGDSTSGSLRVGIPNRTAYRIFSIEIDFLIMGEQGTILDKVRSGTLIASVFWNGTTARIIGQSIVNNFADPELSVNNPSISIGTSSEAPATNGVSLSLLIPSQPDRYSYTTIYRVFEGQSSYRT